MSVFSLKKNKPLCNGHLAIADKFSRNCRCPLQAGSTVADGCTFTFIDNVFGISESLATQTFNHVVRELVVNLFEEYVKLPSTEQEWINKIKGFIENYEFPCIGAWDGFHVHISSKLTTTILNIDIQSQTQAGWV